MTLHTLKLTTLQYKALLNAGTLCTHHIRPNVIIQHIINNGKSSYQMTPLTIIYHKVARLLLFTKNYSVKNKPINGVNIKSKENQVISL